MKKILVSLLCLAAVVTVSAASVQSSALGARVCLQHVYEWQEAANGAMTVSEADPYYCGGWSVTVVEGTKTGSITVNGGITAHGLSQNMLVSGNVVTLEIGDKPSAVVTSTSTSVAGGVTTRLDSVVTYYVVNEDWLVNGAALTSVMGELLSDGSIHIADGFAYYIETSVTTTITGKDGQSYSYTDETVSTSPIYRDTWLLVANGKHEFVNESDGTTCTVDVNIRQSGDTVWVTNLYGYGAPEVYMILDENATMTYPSQMIRDIPDEMSPNGSGMWQNSAETGAVTTQAITWGQTIPGDGVQTWSGWNSNRLYYTDGSEFVIPGTEPQGLRGDANNDGSVTISDVTALIGHLLNGDLAESDTFSPTNSDTNLDGGLNISDVTALINYLLSGNWPN